MACSMWSEIPPSTRTRLNPPPAPITSRIIAIARAADRQEALTSSRLRPIRGLNAQIATASVSSRAMGVGRVRCAGDREPCRRGSAGQGPGRMVCAVLAPAGPPPRDWRTGACEGALAG
ncbi:hypothetical protein AQI95_38475 [Streptomyces yokosukanensis]|uniref:Uncharacterized protein n=1 Tax=Streptomyces yokosukanensis TaxID=67386 RepID=A0A101NUH9_9ACTN|nr:hypothetical protein AQI95_38475 [Streptomyces yokosukanensis]